MGHAKGESSKAALAVIAVVCFDFRRSTLRSETCRSRFRPTGSSEGYFRLGSGHYIEIMITTLKRKRKKRLWRLLQVYRFITICSQNDRRGAIFDRKTAI